MRHPLRAFARSALFGFCAVLVGACDPGDAPVDDTLATPPTGAGLPVAANRASNALCLAGSRSTRYGLEPVFSDLELSLPVAMAQVPGGLDGPFYIAEKHGRVIVAEPLSRDETRWSEVLQLSVATEQESGITALTFHPDHARNGRAFVAYGAQGERSALEFRVSEFARGADGVSLVDERRILTVPKDNSLHFGGALAFGPDGYLYVSIGDDGSNLQFDTKPEGAQDPAILHGSILRIDVDTPSGVAYAVPPDNPDHGSGVASPVWATGFRNPWRMSFDAEPPHTLWSGDVGWFRHEEINRITKGADYGWPVCEGPCAAKTPAHTDPTYAYPNTAGAAVIGGYVYRGTSMPELYGRYIFADFTDRVIRAFDPEAPEGSAARVRSLLGTPTSIAGFAEGNDRELYTLDLFGGSIHRLVSRAEADVVEPPARLSRTGCFAFTRDGDPKPLPGVLPYETAQPFWSDGAGKKRLLALPDGTSIDARDEDAWELPPGAVTIKHFYLDESIVETRFFVRYDDGTYGGHTYAWDDDRNDASLVEADGRTTMIDGKRWDFPSRNDCMRCHDEKAGFSLSLETRQLNVAEATHLGGETAQLTRLSAAGIVVRRDDEPPGPYPSRADFEDDSTSLDDRARSYLHVNCASCHRGEGSAGRARWDARYTTAIEDTGLCGEEPYERVGLTASADERLVAPGRPTLSTLWLRMMDRGGSAAMPPLASHLIDSDGTRLIERWIGSMNERCGTGLP